MRELCDKRLVTLLSVRSKIIRYAPLSNKFNSDTILLKGKRVYLDDEYDILNIVEIEHR